MAHDMKPKSLPILVTVAAVMVLLGVERFRWFGGGFDPSKVTVGFSGYDKTTGDAILWVTNASSCPISLPEDHYLIRGLGPRGGMGRGHGSLSTECGAIRLGRRFDWSEWKAPKTACVRSGRPESFVLCPLHLVIHGESRHILKPSP